MTNDDLRDDLEDIQGVGPATTDEILDVLSEHDTTDMGGWLGKAVEAAEDGDDREAVVFLRRAARED